MRSKADLFLDACSSALLKAGYDDTDLLRSELRLRSLFAIQPVVNLRSELKRSVPAFDDLLRSGDQTERILKGYED